jgi:hypothetical protein
VQILNSQGKKETAIAAYHVSDGIDQCCVGFLHHHFVAHAKIFDEQATEINSSGSESPTKQKKYCHNMGCCLAAIISDFSSGENSISKSTNNFFSKIAKGEVESEEEMVLLTRLGGNNEGVVSHDDPGASVAAA